MKAVAIRYVFQLNPSRRLAALIAIGPSNAVTTKTGTKEKIQDNVIYTRNGDRAAKTTLLPCVYAAPQAPHHNPSSKLPTPLPVAAAIINRNMSLP